MKIKTKIRAGRNGCGTVPRPGPGPIPVLEVV